MPAPTGNAAEDADLRRVALRCRRSSNWLVLRALRHQRFRPELDSSPHIHLAARRQRWLGYNQAIPTNDVNQPNYRDSRGVLASNQGNYDITLAVDPTNPNIVYLGGR